MTALTITAADWASVQDGTLWLVREGEPCATPRSCPKFTRQMCRWNGNHPPVEFVQACAPCETCRDTKIDRRFYFGEDRACPDCLIKLIRPAYGSMWPTHLGWGYAVGQPLPIVEAGKAVDVSPCLSLMYNDGRTITDGPGIGQRGYRWSRFDGERYHPVALPPALAHYGPPESLVGKWALQVQVVQ